MPGKQTAFARDRECRYDKRCRTTHTHFPWSLTAAWARLKKHVFGRFFQRLRCDWVIRQKVLLFALDMNFLTHYNKYDRGINLPRSLTNAELWGFFMPEKALS